MNEYDLIEYALSKDGNYSFSPRDVMSMMKHVSHASRDPDTELVEEINYMRDRNDDLSDRITDLKSQLEAAKNDKNTAQRKLKLFLKAATRLKFVDKLKIEIPILVEEEKIHVKFSKFFGTTTNQLEAFEEELDDFEEKK